MMEYMKKKMMIPGQVENVLVIIDVDNMALQNIPFKVSIQVVTLLKSLKFFLETFQN
jgi:hypothetical protein